MTEDEKVALEQKAAADKAKKDSDDKAAAEAKAKEDTARSDAEVSSKLDKLLAGIDTLCTRQDRMDARMDAFEKSGESGEEKAAADKAKKDADEKEAMEKAEADKVKKDAEEKEASRADRARIDSELAALKARLPMALSDADYTQMADAQAKADTAFSAHGERAPRPLDGETPGAYRKRLAGGLKKFSADWKDVDLTPLEGTVLQIAEGRIYADALEAAMHPTDLPDGMLRPIVSRDATGREITRFVGEPSAWMAQFRSPARRLARPLFKQPHREGG